MAKNPHCGDCCCRCRWFCAVSLLPRLQVPQSDFGLTLALTLIAVIIYVYYTYVLAKELDPNASISFQRTEQDPLGFLAFVTNSSKVSLHCWCNLNAKVNGQAVSLGGFYGGQSSFDVQPYNTVQGHFSLRDFLARANRTVEEMIQNAQPGDRVGSIWTFPSGTTPSGQETKSIIQNSRTILTLKGKFLSPISEKLPLKKLVKEPVDSERVGDSIHGPGVGATGAVAGGIGLHNVPCLCRRIVGQI